MFNFYSVEVVQRIETKVRGALADLASSLDKIPEEDDGRSLAREAKALASDSTTSEILEDYPDLTEADIQACIAYGAEMARERYVDVPLEPAV